MKLPKNRRVKRGKFAEGTGDEYQKFVKCPHCGFMIDTTKISITDRWCTETSTDGLTPYTQEIKVTYGCPLCGLGAYR